MIEVIRRWFMTLAQLICDALNMERPPQRAMSLDQLLRLEQERALRTALGVRTAEA